MNPDKLLLTLFWISPLPLSWKQPGPEDTPSRPGPLSVTQGFGYVPTHTEAAGGCQLLPATQRASPALQLSWPSHSACSPQTRAPAVPAPCLLACMWAVEPTRELPRTKISKSSSAVPTSYQVPPLPPTLHQRAGVPSPQDLEGNPPIKFASVVPSTPTLLGGCTGCVPGAGGIEGTLSSSSKASLALVGLALLSHSLCLSKSC